MRKVLALLLIAMLALTAIPFAMAEGNVLRYGTETEPAGFDPHTVSSHASLRVMAQVYNQLVDVNENLEIVPELATSWEISDDNLTYTFHLADNVYFHSGRKMTAEDVKYSYERILNPDLGALGNSSSYAGIVDTVEVVDDLTVKMTLKEVNVTFLANQSSSYCSIVDKDVVEANEGSLLRADGGTGPYTLGEWVADNHVTVNAYDNYFNDAEKATFDAIEFYVMTDANSRLNALRTGAVDLIVADTAMLDLVNEGDDIQIISYQTRDYVGLFMNCEREPYTNPLVRQAINYALDREEIIDFAYNGTAAISGFIPASLGHWAVDVTEKDYYTQNVEKAKELLAEAGYPDGFETVITVGLEDGIRDMGIVAKEQLGAIGIKVEVKNIENAQYIDDWKTHNFDIMICHNGAGSDPNRGVAFFFSSTGSANIQGYSNARVDELCVLGAGTTNVEEREAYYKEAINIILDECATATVACPMAYFMASPALQGYAPNASNTSNFAGVTLAK
ncbi:MAG: ABC transporter substrate-binding protein [Clostridia bacterium]|nr:ABC transporter substrate-binding protein [Clostridia bacterium]